MKIVLHEGKYKVLDSLNRVAVLYVPLIKLDDIFHRNNGWAGRVIKKGYA